MGKIILRLWRYPLHKLGVLKRGGIEVFAWGVVINFTQDSGLMLAWVSRDVDEEKLNETLGRGSPRPAPPERGGRGMGRRRYRSQASQIVKMPLWGQAYCLECGRSVPLEHRHPKATVDVDTVTRPTPPESGGDDADV